MRGDEGQGIFIRQLKLQAVGVGRERRVVGFESREHVTIPLSRSSIVAMTLSELNGLDLI